MAKTYYAWSPIQVHDGEKLSTVQPGTEVTKDSLHTDEDHWNALIEGGSVRTTEWPSDLDPKNPNALSPNEHRLAKLRKEREALEAEMAGVGGVPGDTTPSALDEDDEGVASSSEPQQAQV